MSFQDEIRQIRLERQEAMRKKKADMQKESYAAESEPFIEHCCDLIRTQIRGAARAGAVLYDERNAYKFIFTYPARRSNPHYIAHLFFKCLMDLTKDDFYWDRRERVVKISDLCTLRYILREIGRRLAQDSIYSVQCTEKSLDNFGEWIQTQTVKRNLYDPSFYAEFQETAKEYALGIGKPVCDSVVAADFAYFL